MEVCEVVFSELVVANVWHPRALALTYHSQQPQQQRAT